MPDLIMRSSLLGPKAEAPLGNLIGDYDDRYGADNGPGAASPEAVQDHWRQRRPQPIRESIMTTSSDRFATLVGDPANQRAHFETTGPEIWRETTGEVDILVAAVGSVVTLLSGIAGGALSGWVFAVTLGSGHRHDHARTPNRPAAASN